MASLTSKIETREEALKAIKDSANGFFAVAALQAILGAFLAPSLIIDALVIAATAFIMRQWKSRPAAFALLIMSLLILGITLGNRLGLTQEGGSNIFLAGFMVWIAIRSVKATIVANRTTTPPAPTRPMTAGPRRA